MLASSFRYNASGFEYCMDHGNSNQIIFFKYSVSCCVFMCVCQQKFGKLWRFSVIVDTRHVIIYVGRYIYKDVRRTDAKSTLT